MSKEMVISANPHETRVAIMEEGLLCEYYVEREKEFALVGSIYKGKVTRVLPGMQSAFVEIGLDSDAFLYVSDFMEEIEELDHVVTTVEDKTQKMEDQGGQVFPANTGTAPIIEPLDVEGPHSGVGPGAAPGAFAGAGAGTGLEPLPGESISAVRGQSAPGTFSPAVSRPSGGGHGSDRGRFENRSRGGRPGGDRGGRFGRRGGSGSGGGRGRSGGGGSRPGGDRGGRFGRELPSSKYASSRPADEHSSEPGAPEGHISTLLPGESLAKFREKGPADISASSAQTHSHDVEAAPGYTPSFEQQESVAHESEAHGNVHEDVHEDAHEEIHDSIAHARAEEQPADYRPAPAGRESSGRGSFPARESFPRRNEGFRAPSSSGGLEPLPGETLSKWKAHTHLPPEPLAPEPGASESPASDAQDNAPVPDAVRFAPLSPLMPPGPEVDSSPMPDAHVEEPAAQNSRDWNQVEALSPNFELSDAPEVHEHHEAGHHEEHPHVDLTEEEAAALAEHIADAQDDDAARDAQNRVFAAADAAADAGVHEHHDDHDEHDTEGHEGHGAEEHAEDSEESELEQEEAAAEEEGMLAPAEPVPGEIEGPDSIAAQAENGGALSAEGLQAAVQQPSQARVRGDFRSRMQNPARRGGRDRGRRDDRGGSRRPQHGHSGGHSHGRPQQPRRTQLIADMLKQGQEIIVQIAKEPLGKKGARITSHVALPGRFLVYMPTLDHTGVSRKIASAEERARLRHLVTEAKGTSGGGFIVRTAAASAAPDEVRADVEFLTRTWSEIKARSETRKAPSLLHRDLNLVERILRDYITPDFGAIWVDTEEEYTKVVDFMSRFQPQLVGRVKLYTKETPVFEEFGIQQEIDKGLRPKVWLKSGGYIVINHTEALVAIDVNTGKFVGKGSNRLE